MNHIQAVTTAINETRDTFLAVLSDPSLNFDREAEFAVQILTGNDYLLKIAAQNRQSVIDAVTNVAAIGISLNPAKKQAYLVPRKGRVCLDIGYMGLLDLAMATGSIRWGQARLVCEKDHFELRGIDREPEHRYQPFGDRGDVVGVYCVVKTADGDYLTEAMSIADVNAIRDRSEAWKAWLSKQTKCPWITDPGEMAKKTVVKRAYKFWPRNDRLDRAIHHLSTDGGEGLIDASSPADNCPDDLLTAARAAALNGLDAYAAFFKGVGIETRRLLASHHESLKAAAVKSDAERTVENES